MTGIRARIGSLWRALRRREDLEAEMLEEFRHHIELRARDLERTGMSKTEAMRRARLEFGHVETHRESARASRGLRWFDEAGFSWLDVKLGIRMIRKYPGLTAVSVIGMAVAIAVGAGFFGFIEGQLDPKLPLQDGERIVALQLNTETPGSPERRVLHDFVLWRAELTSVTDVGAFRLTQRNAETPAGTHLVQVAEITAAGFRVARTPPLMGRPLLDEDEAPGTPAVAVIAEEEWRQRFNADPNVIGSTLRLGGQLHTIVGVMPAAFRFPVNDRWWVPLRLDPADYDVRTGPAIHVFGRLADGATMERARAELATLGARMAAQHPETHARLRPDLLPYAHTWFDVDTPGIALALRLAQAGVSLLLVLVAANVATLVYARTATRIGEIAVRSALGASRRRIVAQLFVEAFVVSILAAAIGLGAAAYALAQLQAFVQREASGMLPFWFDVGMSRGLVLYVAVLAVLAGVIVGVLPALKATGRRVQAGLQQLAARGSQMRLGRTWTVLIVAQVATAVAVLPFAVHIASRSVERSFADPLFPIAEVLHASLSLDRDVPAAALAAGYDSAMDARLVDRTRTLLHRLEAEPAVAGVAFARHPLDTGPHERFEVEGGPTLSLIANEVDVDAFEVIGVPVVGGRDFAAANANGAPHTAIVSSSMAEHLGGPVVGRRIRAVPIDDESERGPWLEIVGVVPEFAMLYDFEAQPPRIYTPLSLEQAGNVALALRIRGENALAFGRRLAGIASSVDPLLQVDGAQTFEQLRRSTQQSLLAVTVLFGSVAGAVLLLSAAGIYAMMSFTVARRRREIGIRTALGAAPRRLLAGIFARAAAQIGAGVVIGLALAGTITRVLLGRGPSIPDALAAAPIVVAILAAVGLAAAWRPARRALAVQPTEVLREE